MNGSLFALAREARGMTQSALADATGISQPVVSKIESGLRRPTEDEAEIFAKVLRYPTSLFSRTEHIYKQSAIVDFMFRKGMSVKQRSLGSVWARLELMALHLKPLIEAVAIEPALPLPRLTSVPREGGASGVAARTRIMWRMPAGPVLDLLGLIEATGVVIVPFTFHDEKIDAVSVSRPDMPPLIFIDLAKPPDRVRSSAAHELGHLIMHMHDREALSDPERDAEQEATEFAGDFLVPASDFSNHVFRGIQLSDFVQLKTRWGVSIQLLIMRAAQDGLISEAQKTNFFKMISARGWRKVEPGSVTTERPTLLGDILGALQTELHYSAEEMATLSGLHESDFRRDILGEQSKVTLRISPRTDIKRPFDVE